MITVGLYIR